MHIKFHVRSCTGEELVEPPSDGEIRHRQVINWDWTQAAAGCWLLQAAEEKLPRRRGRTKYGSLWPGSYCCKKIKANKDVEEYDAKYQPQDNLYSHAPKVHHMRDRWPFSAAETAAADDGDEKRRKESLQVSRRTAWRFITLIFVMMGQRWMSFPSSHLLEPPDWPQILAFVSFLANWLLIIILAWLFTSIWDEKMRRREAAERWTLW